MEYVNILERIMLSWAENEMPLKWVFQQENDPKHASKGAKLWFQANKVSVMQGPAQSPDLNAIENVWGKVKAAVNEANHKDTNELWDVVCAAWTAIPVERCNKLVDSMQRRCLAVIKNKGGTTKY